MSVPTLPAPVRTAPAARRAAGASPRLRAARPRAVVVPPSLEIGESPAAAVFRAVRTRGPLTRDVVAKATGLSIATVNRQVSALLDVGVLRERGDLTPSGAVGRPRVPFDVDHERFATVGIHVGAVVTSIIASDLRGRVLGAVEIPTPRTHSDEALTSVARSARAFAGRWHRRTPLWAGVAIGGRVDAATGVVDHPRLGWTGAQVGQIIGAGLGLPVSVAAHVEAMAASELLLAHHDSEESEVAEPVAGETGMYFYAREMAGIAITIDGRVHTPSTGPGSIAHFPTGSSAQCSCGAVGCLEATVSDRAIIDAAVAKGIVPQDGRPTVAAVVKAALDGSEDAHELLVERARVLGRTVATLRDLFNPDRVILGGQAFTEYERGLPHVASAFAQASRLGRKDVRVTGFGNRVQEYASTVVSLSTLFADPVGAIRRTTAA
ncbi:ROK family transcriptional regulator [Rhodococcus sp. HNM0569]|uniref:ROK family transcriptional regulator n=1 Tax=Rhodococcus sp. HNM0569 TaxID=2716340 RepID=UPI00146B5CCE|nr:ROK family transcriptional regulator [Rhodococcus sp. HNM0569]NLU84080.1 ROK family transcriptional regulator [Rhodococcus sp. HNM0569]